VRWRYATVHDAGAQRTQGAFDFHGHADHRAWIWLRPFEAPVEAPDRDFPFWLETGEVLEHSDAGSVTRRIPTLRRAVPAAYVELNREDADRLGVRDGERVRLASRRGALELTARIDLRSQPRRGVLFVPWFDAQHAVNLLTLDASCPVSGQPDYGCAVRIERAPSARGET
jgi:nitrate reductase NapA